MSGPPSTSTRSRSRRVVISLAGLAFVATAVLVAGPPIAEHLFSIEMPDGPLAAMPSVVGVRSGDVTLNFNGVLGSGQEAEYRLNGDDWSPVPQAGPRAPEPAFLVEVPADALLANDNRFELRVTAADGTVSLFERAFDVSTQSGLMPEPQDGLWDWDSDLSSIRPAPGREGYDRLFILDPSLAGGRHVSARMEFHGSTQGLVHRLRFGAQYGVGLVALWGGHLEQQDVRPRRGWLYGLAWFYARDNGFGSEAAQRVGSQPMNIAKTYADWSPSEGQSVQMDAYAAPVQQEDGVFLGWCLLSVLVSDDETIHPNPLFVTPEILPRRDYGAGLIAHRVDATFTSVDVQQIDPIIAEMNEGEAACARFSPPG